MYIHNLPSFASFPFDDTCGTIAMNDELFVVDSRARRRQHPRERLFRQAGHLIALRTKEVDVVAGAFARRFLFVFAESPGPIRTLNSVKEASFQQSLQSPVDCNPIQGSCHFALLEDILVRKWPPSIR